MCENRFCSTARKKSPPGRVRAPAPTWLGKSPRRFAKSAKEWAPGQKADSSPLKRIRNDKYLKPGSRRGAPRNDKYVSEGGGGTLGVCLRFPFGKIREAVSASLAAGVHRCFVGSRSRGGGLWFRRMKAEGGRVWS